MPFAVALNKANFHANGKQIQTLSHFFPVRQSPLPRSLLQLIFIMPFFHIKSNLIFISNTTRCMCTGCLFLLNCNLNVFAFKSSSN